MADDSEYEELAKQLGRMVKTDLESSLCRGQLQSELLMKIESWPRKSAQDAKWSFCLTAGTLWPANQERA